MTCKTYMKPDKISTLKKRPFLFRRLTGLTPYKFRELLNFLQPIYNKSEAKRLERPNRKRKKGGGRHKDLALEHQLLLLLMYYRFYISHELLGFIFNLHNSNVSRYINYLQPLLCRVFRIPECKIELPEADLSEAGLIEIFFDSTEQPIHRPKHKQKNYYSGKKKRHTLKNQVVVNKNGKILSVSKSTHGSMHDKNLYDNTKTYTDKECKKTGDLGYLGVASFTLPIKKPKGKCLTEEQKHYNRQLSKRRVIVENSIGKMKIFQILVQRFRNELKKHTLIFKNVAGLHNLMFANY